MERQQWPNLFVVGAAKAGTTSLWRYLDRHPEIHMAAVKEPDFFAAKRDPATAPDAAEYLALFADAGDARWRGEASPSYLSRRHVPPAIRSVSPDARIVISLREPIERTHSSYLSLVADGVERRSFPRAVADDLAGRRVPGAPRYVKPRLYGVGLKRYLKAFGEQVFVLFFEELKSDPAGTLRELYSFLEVDPAVAEQMRPKAENTFREPRNRAVGRVLRAPRGLRSLVPAPLRARASGRLTKPARKPKPEPEAVRLLQEAFGPDVASVRRRVARPLPKAWDRRFPAREPQKPTGLSVPAMPERPSAPAARGS